MTFVRIQCVELVFKIRVNESTTAEQTEESGVTFGRWRGPAEGLRVRKAQTAPKAAWTAGPVTPLAGFSSRVFGVSTSKCSGFGTMGLGGILFWR